MGLTIKQRQEMFVERKKAGGYHRIHFWVPSKTFELRRDFEKQLLDITDRWGKARLEKLFRQFLVKAEKEGGGKANKAK